MPMSSATLAAELEKFMVPATNNVNDLPPGIGTGAGWPDGTDPPPEPTAGVSPAASTGPATISASALTPGAFANGYISAPPYWDGAKITSNTATLVQVSVGAANPAGPQSANIVATADGQHLFQAPGYPNIGAVQSVVRTEDGALLAVNPGEPGHNPATGAVGIHPPTPDILTGETVSISYLLAFSGVVPAGVGYTLVPPKSGGGSASYTVGDAWSKAYAKMFSEGGANGIPPTPGTYDAATQAMKLICDGMMAVPVLGPIALQAGASAFWGMVAASSAAIFPGSVSGVPPATVAGMGAAFALAGAASLLLGPLASPPAPTPIPWNRSIGVAATALLAGSIYTTSQGGLIIFQPGPVPVPFPFI